MKPSDQQIVSAISAIANAGLCSMIWLDHELKVERAIGDLPVPVNHHAHVSDVLPFMFGLESALAELSPATPPIHIHNIALISSDGTSGTRYDVSVFRSSSDNGFLVVSTAVLTADNFTSDLEHEQKRVRLMERDIAERTMEIQRINAQLEEFTYAISHDLNAPLRAIRLLNEDIRTILAPLSRSAAGIDHSKLKKTVDAIGSQTRRMSNMLTGLLEYAKVGRKADTIEIVDTRPLIREIVDSMKSTTPISVTIKGAWPSLNTARAPLDLVMRNLVDNAIKHHDQPATGRVTVTSHTIQPDADHWQIEVADDGPGIPAEWHHAIFEAFRRIDDQHHPDSSGLGLALIRKAARNLGGDISVCSEAPKQRGTVFMVRWPLELMHPSNN